MWNMTPEQFEIDQQRRQERVICAQCEVFDAVAQFLVDRDVDDKQTMRDAIDIAIRRFGNGPILPNMMIASLVGKQINIEKARRAEIAQLPPPVRKDRYGRPILPSKPVLWSGKRRIA